MKREVRKSWLFAAAMLALTGGCVSGDNQNNDDESSPSKDAGKPTKDAGKDSGGKKDAGSETGDDDGDDDDNADDDAPADDDATGQKDSGAGGVMDAGAKDAGNGGAKDSGSGGGNDSGGGGATNPVEGTADSCQSYTMPTGGKCGSYYCNVTKADIAAVLKPGGKCDVEGEDIAGQTCSADIVFKTGECARAAQIENLGADDATIRMAAQACIYEDSKFEKYPEDCVGCFLDVAKCAADNCLIQCLAGDSPECDTCRKDANCEEPVFACGGLPNPF